MQDALLAAFGAYSMSQILFAGRRFIDENGNPISGGKLYVYEADTTTPRDTYINDGLTTIAPNPIVLSSAGMMTTNSTDEGPIYVAPDNYRLVLRSSDDATTYFDIDNLTIIDPTAIAEADVVNITSNTTVSSDQREYLFYANTSSGNVTVTADSNTLGKGFVFHVKKSSSDANSLLTIGTGSQTVDGSSSFARSNQYDAATLVSLGAAGWAVLAQSSLVTIPNGSFLGNNTGGTAAPTSLTGAQATSLLSAFVGDSGSGGTKGIVPAPATGDAAKALIGNGTFSLAEGIDASKDVTGTEGYVSLPGGVILQWGRATASGGVASVTLPVTFPTAIFSVVVTDAGADPSGGVDNNNAQLTAASVSTTGFNVSCAGTVHWLAVGN